MAVEDNTSPWFSLLSPNTGEDEPMYGRASGSWTGMYLLLDVLPQTARYYGIRAKSSGQEKHVQNVKNGLSHLQGADLQRMLGRRV